MFVEPADYRPSSPLREGAVSALAVLGGVGMTVSVYATMAILATVLSVATGRSVLDQRAIAEEPEVTPPVEPEVVEAGFVQLGREWDPRELPDRRIASNMQEARSQDPNVVSPYQRLLSPDAGVRPPSTALNALINDNAYSEDGNATLRFEDEGQAWGAERAQEGDTIVGQLVSLLRRGTEVPSNLAESEYARTSARVCGTVDSAGVVSAIRFASTSGNDDWDRAVRNRVDQIAEAHPRLVVTPGSEGSLGRDFCIAVVPRASRRRSAGGSAPGGAFGNLLNGN